MQNAKAVAGAYLCDQAAYARAFKAYSSSKRLRSAATWLRPGPPRATRQSEEEEGDSEPLLLLEAGDINWLKQTKKGTVITYLQVFPQLFLLSCVSHVASAVWLEKPCRLALVS